MAGRPQAPASLAEGRAFKKGFAFTGKDFGQSVQQTKQAAGSGRISLLSMPVPLVPRERARLPVVAALRVATRARCRGSRCRLDATPHSVALYLRKARRLANADAPLRYAPFG